MSRSLKYAAVLCAVLILLPSRGVDAAMLRKGKFDGGTSQTPPVNTGRGILPKKGDIAVVVDGDLAPMAEAAIIETLTQHGYRVVDEKKMKSIRAAAARAKAARLALEGNVAGILRISSGYSVGATIVAHVTAGQAKENEFKLYTGTASVTLLAVRSNGTKLGGETTESKQVAYTEDETQRKAVKAAVEAGMARMF